MLAQQNRDQVDLPAGRLEAREDELFLQLLVIVFDEAADDARGARDHRQIELLVVLDAVSRLVVDEQDALEHAVLLHQVLAGSDLRLFALVLVLRLTSACGCRRCRARERDARRERGGPQDFPAALDGLVRSL